MEMYTIHLVTCQYIKGFSQSDITGVIKHFFRAFVSDNFHVNGKVDLNDHTPV